MIMGVAFFNTVTCLAYKKLGKMTMRSISMVVVMIVNMIMITGDISIQSFDAVNETVTGEKIQGPINRRRFRTTNLWT